MSIHLFLPSPLSIPHPLFSPPCLLPKQPLIPPLNTSNNPLSSTTPKPPGRPKAKINNKKNPTTPPNPIPPKGSSQNPVSPNGSDSESQIVEVFPSTRGRPKGKMKKTKTPNTPPKPKPPKGSPQNPVSQSGSDSESEIMEDLPDTRGGRKGKKMMKKNATTQPKPNLPKGSPQNPVSQSGSDSESETDEDFPYMDPPLVCCFGSVKREFLPSVRVAEHRMDPDVYSEWKMLQWKPPEFARAPGGSAGNVAISHVRLGGRAEFMGKVGRDEFGEEMVYMMNSERVQTRSVWFDDVAKTGCCYMRVKFGDGGGKMRMEVVRDAAEDSLLPCELNLDVLKEARIFHFNSEVLTSPSMRSTLFAAITLSKKYGGLIFFDLNLPLPLWKNRDETRAIIKQAWEESDIIEVSREELEFLLDEDYYHKKRTHRPQYYADNYDDTKRNMSEYYHYTPEEVSPLWHDKLKILFVTDGTLRIHYYTPSFDGVVVGTEDVLITPFTCDRTGSGDAVVAAIMRKLTTCDMYGDRDVLERQLRFAVAAGIISQWTIGAVRGFPTESAAQNLKEQVYVPSMW